MDSSAVGNDDTEGCKLGDTLGRKVSDGAVLCSLVGNADGVNVGCSVGEIEFVGAMDSFEVGGDDLEGVALGQ